MEKFRWIETFHIERRKEEEKNTSKQNKNLFVN